MTGCAGQPVLDAELPSSELSEVPFFPQSRYQCGPAALATVLAASDLDVSPDDLVSEVYLPERRGSLQIELKAAARRRERLPVEIPPDIHAVLEEVAAGLPVLVLQNLGFAWLPRWHYAVVVGYDAEREFVLLRSGRTERHQERLDRFLRSWSLADGWAIVVVQPGQIPRNISSDTYLQAVLNSGRAWSQPTTLRALAAGVERWPDDADLNFALANEMRVQDAEAAARLYRRALEEDDEHLGVLNNYADLLAEVGCAAEGMRVIERGVNAAAADSPLLNVLKDTRAEIELRLADSDAAGCPVIFQN